MSLILDSVSVTTFLNFLEMWKCQEIRLMSGKRPKVRERSGNLYSPGKVCEFVAAQQNNLPVHYAYSNSFSYMMFTENLD